MNSDSGSSTSTEPEPPERIGAGDHDLHQPAGVGAAVKAQRELQDMFEVVGEHGMTVAVREPVGIERHDRSACDGEQPEADPGRKQDREIAPRRSRALGLRTRERIDDPAEQYGFGELGGRERDVGGRQHPAEPCFRPEQLQNAHIELDEIHDAGI
jgi:hypothetical protein